LATVLARRGRALGVCACGAHLLPIRGGSTRALDLMSRTRGAPPFIAGLYVLAFAYVDRSVRFEQRHTLNVDGKWLGRVPCLALCEPFDKAGMLIQHCDKNWYPLGIEAGYKSIQDAKKRVERSYHGITAKWTKQSVPKKGARALYQAELKSESCSFCGRTPLQFTAVVGSKVRICNHCVDKFHEALHA
jgi:hypothetical protein